MKIEIDAIFHLKSLLKACKKLFINVTTREGGVGGDFFFPYIVHTYVPDAYTVVCVAHEEHTAIGSNTQHSHTTTHSNKHIYILQCYNPTFHTANYRTID